MKSKSKAKEFFEGLGMTLSIIWMSPILICEEIREHCEKKKKTKESRQNLSSLCTECGTVFKAYDIGHFSWQDSFRSPNPFPSRCPNWHQMKTLPFDEKNTETYKPLWTMLELAEETKEARKSKKLLEKVAFAF